VTKLCSALALVVAISSSAVMAQTGGRASAPAASGSKGTVIAIVDINYIISKHDKAVALRETTQKKDREAVAALQARKKDLDKEQEKLRDHKIGSPEHRAIQEKLIQRSAELEADAKVGRSQIQEDFAKAQLEILLEVQAAIKAFATRNGIDIVLNFDSEKPNADNPQMLNRYAMNLVQFQDSLDISTDILEIVSPNYAVAKKTAPVGGSGAGKSNNASPVRPNTKSR
jgi:Skp family chaperone for outer membrane proteins